jgi:hypothetical protein
MPIDAPVTSPTKASDKTNASTKVWVEVPEDDIFEQRHPDIIVNGIHYGPGKHYVDSVLAGTINERIKLYARAQARLNSSRPDKVTRLRQLPGGSSNIAGLK